MTHLVHQNWRNCEAWKSSGLPLSTTSDEAAKMFDACLTQYVGWYNDESVDGIEGALSKMTNADPNFLMGHVMSVGLEMMATAKTTRLDTSFRQDVDAMLKLAKNNHVTEREKKHVEAVKLWSDGKMDDAAYLWEDILISYPLDMLALKFAHDTYFYNGLQYELMDSTARVLPHWKEDMPLYGYLMGMHSFGLVETNHFQEAERVAKKGLEINRHDSWSTHSVAHVFEMTGRADEGIAFMSKTVADWSPCEMLACHNFWHWAVYHVDKGEYSGALDLLDDQMIASFKKSGAMFDMIDACSMLYRLELEGVDVGLKRWEDIYEMCRPHIDDHILLFNDLHLLMACLGAKKREVAQAFMASLRQFVENESDMNQVASKKFGIAMAEAFIAYDDGDYARAVELANKVRYQLLMMGGSNAQRDVFHLFLVHAALKSDQPKHHKLARNLIMERKSARPGCKMNDRLLGKILGTHGQ
ncbi:tetratricopeptide repeat protein 38-like [Lineus longissimus]|uniref:tetratricopeptide repeat protein 38-like n=1 Tax=Lineus longissimus TaxID=88925 RepID=UPI002B4D2509